MAAAENGALPGAKVGGIADVVRELPAALAALGSRVSVVCPSHGLLGAWPGARRACTLQVRFGGTLEAVDLYRVPVHGAADGVQQYALDHPGFSPCGRGVVYCDDGPARPFASDASKFALFSAAVAEALQSDAFGTVQVVHLHDWHTALALVLRRFDPACRRLRALRTVFTIHNLALQGVRPLTGDPSSFAAWFPALHPDPAVVGDPRWPGCVNPMAAAIRLADAVSTVSPSYAEEILRPNDLEVAGRHGGEGLEEELRAVHARGALFGILNGCEYPSEANPGAAPDWPDMLAQMRRETLRLAGEREPLSSAHFVAWQRLAALKRKRPSALLTTVGRVTPQKLGLLRTPAADGRPALDGVLDALGEHGLYLVLGSGDPALEQFLTAVSARRANLVYLRGYVPALPEALYARGDLFLMPSSYEPCGITQMLAMRAGQPCVVHAVGGLKDTVRDGVNGFAFDGDTSRDQADALVATVARALALRADKPKRFAALRDAARAARFPWHDSARIYRDRLYGGD